MFDPDHVDVELPELARLGVDPLADGLDADRRCGRCSPAAARRLKPLLLDQHVIAGIGNIYADEILHAARLHPDRVGRLAAAGRRCAGCTTRCTTSCAAAVGAGGSTLGDAQYVDLMGVGRLLPGRPPRLRPGGRALPDLRPGHHPARRRRRPLDALLPASASGCRRERSRTILRCPSEGR